MQTNVLLRDTNDSYVANLKSATMSTINQELFLIHCGWNTKNRSWDSQKRNFDETTLISEYCQLRNIQLIFISSQSATSRSNYGEMKKRAEASVLSNGGLVIRPGLIIFNQPSGLQKILSNKILSKVPIRMVPEVSIRTVTSLHLIHFITELIDGKVPQNRTVDLFDDTVTLNSVMGTTFSQSSKVPIPILLIKPGLKALGRVSQRFYSLYDSFLGLTS